MVMHFTYDVGERKAGHSGAKPLSDPLYYNQVLVVEEYLVGRHVFVGNGAEIWQIWLDLVGHCFDGEGKQIAETENDFLVLAVGSSVDYSGALCPVEWAGYKAQSKRSPIQDKAHFDLWKRHEVSCQAALLNISLLDYLLRLGTVEETSLFSEYLANFEFDGFDREDFKNTLLYKERHKNGELNNVKKFKALVEINAGQHGVSPWGAVCFPGGENGAWEAFNNKCNADPY